MYNQAKEMMEKCKKLAGNRMFDINEHFTRFNDLVDYCPFGHPDFFARVEHSQVIDYSREQDIEFAKGIRTMKPFMLATFYFQEGLSNTITNLKPAQLFISPYTWYGGECYKRIVKLSRKPGCENIVVEVIKDGKLLTRADLPSEKIKDETAIQVFDKCRVVADELFSAIDQKIRRNIIEQEEK